MTRLLISTAVAGLLALGGTARAQGDDHRGRDAGHDQAARPAPQAAPAAAARPDNRGHMDQRPGAPAQAAPAAAPVSRAGIRGHGPGNTPAPANAMRGPAPNNATRGPDNRSAGPSNAIRGPAPGNRGARPNYSSYQRNFSAPHHYRAPSSYRRPNGWYAQRWTYGQILPSLFWAQDYWLSNYYDYGLMPPPPGTVWVRDGDDALLIDRDSGEIIQVEYSVFY